MSKRILSIFNVIIACFCMMLLMVGCKGDSITINGLTSVVVGKSITLTAKLNTENEEKNIEFIWESEHPDVASVNDEGVVYGVKAGETTIYASYKEYTGKIKIKVLIIILIEVL